MCDTEGDDGTLPRLYLLHSTRNEIWTQTLDVDCHRKEQEVRKVVHVFVCLACLHAGEECDHDRTHVLLEISRRDVLHDGLEELEAPAVVELRRDQALLHDGEDSGVLARRNHLPRVAREEGLEQLDKAGDATLLLPTCRCEQEGKKLAVGGRDV